MTKDDGLIVKKYKGGRVRYPDPLSEDLEEAHFGALNFLRQTGQEDERAQLEDQRCQRAHKLVPAEPMPKEFSPEDVIRAHGLGVRLELTLDQITACVDALGMPKGNAAGFNT